MTLAALGALACAQAAALSRGGAATLVQGRASLAAWAPGCALQGAARAAAAPCAARAGRCARAQDRKSAPVKLALLVGCGILLPLGVAAWFLFRTQKYHGPNNVAQETLDIFCRRAPAPARPPAAVPTALRRSMGHRLCGELKRSR
jgi:hypothetical protein